MKPTIFYRTFEVDQARVNVEKREVELSFSSETPIRQWGEDEILLHGKKNADLSRLKSLGALLYGHNSYSLNNILGPIKKVWIDDDRVGRAIVGFDNDENGNLAMQKVESKSLRGVSFAYKINKAVRVIDSEEWQDPDTKQSYKGPAFIATQWQAYEISLTPIPADATVGVNRSLDGIEIETENQNLTPTEENKMDEKEIRDLITLAIKEAVPEVIIQVRSVMAEEAKPKMVVTVLESKDLLARAAAVSPECKLATTDMIMDGKHESEILRFIGDEAMKDPDANDAGDLPGDGTGRNMQTPSGPAVVTSFKQVDDDMFYKSLGSPAAFQM